MTLGDPSDIGIIPTSELGVWADRDDLAPVPALFRSADQVFQWAGVLPPYREHVIEWGGQARALPLAGAGVLIVYRTDRLADPKFIAAFRNRVGRNPEAPSSWEDFAVLAREFAAFDQKPSLPTMTGEETADLFFRVAACFNQQATNDAVKTPSGASLVTFWHDITTGDPRIATPAFRAAADWLASLPKPHTGPVDPAGALAKGDASLAVLTLAQLSKLPRENGQVPARFGLAPLPGTRQYFDPDKKQLVPAGTPNYVPYFAAGKLGVVRSSCKHQDAAFDLLAELGGPTRSLELLTIPGLGVGPFRHSHLERDRLSAWLGYGFDADRSKALQEAMRQYVRPEVRNPVYGLRGPDQAAMNAAAAEELAKIAAGSVTPEAGLAQLLAAWNRIDEKTPKETRLRWRKSSLGVN